MNVLKRAGMTLLLMLAAVQIPLAQAQNACTLDHRANRIRITLAGCPAGTTVAARKNGDDTDPVPLNGANNVWTGDGYDGPMKNFTLCSKICGFASECVKPTPKGEWEGQPSHFVCYADYTFKCGKTSWTLGIDSSPKGLKIVIERTANGTKQHDELWAAPRTLVCDIAYDEQIRVTGVDAVRTDIGLKYDDFDSNRTIEKEIVPAAPATGVRAAETSQNEHLLQSRRKIIFRIDGGS